MDTPKKNNDKVSAAKSKDNAKPAAPAAIPVPPLFRKIDWLTLGITFLSVWVVYLWTLAPELTLEDSGELCTGSFYAGIPHPPGYPFWAIYSWFWTFILPFGNVAWRVEVGESFAAALGCGMVGIMVSRGSSMLIEGIEEIKNITRQWENAICIIAGFVAGTLLGMDGFMWKESVAINRISLFGVPWLIAVVLFLMRWTYAPQQRRYLYLAMLFYGICATIHQTLLLSAMGVEIIIALALPRLGRDLFLGNSIIYVVCVMLKSTIPALANMTNVEAVFLHVVGICSILATIWLAIRTEKLFTEWKSCIIMGVMWVLGVSFYFYMPISGMTDPPMQWGYPRTVEGFFHALSRGQYETAHGLDIFSDPQRFVFQLWYIVQGLADSFSWVYMFVGILPFLFIMKMHKRERSWIIGVTSVYICVSVLLGILLNVSPDRQSSDLNKVFYTASHGLFAMMIGYGLTLLAAYVATHYANFRRWGLVGGAVAFVLAAYCLVDAAGKLYFGPAGGFTAEHTFIFGIITICCLSLVVGCFVKTHRWLKSLNDQTFEKFFVFGGPAILILTVIVAKIRSPELFDSFVTTVHQFAIDFIRSPGEIFHSELPRFIAHAFDKDQYGLPVFANLILIAMCVIFIGALVVYRTRGPVMILLGLFLLMPVYSGLTHWYKSEQRNHWFGYWFGHDMFTPPFQDPKTGKLSYDNVLRAELLKDPKNASAVYPEMARDTILFGGTDPGRFCPTYIIFCESFIPHRCQPEQDQKFDRRDVYIITQNALADGTYLDYLRAQYNRSKQIDPPFFSELSKYVFSLAVGPASADSGLFSAINQALYYTLDVPFTKWGKHVETYRRARGVYPPNEIYIPSPEDSQKCFEDYTQDVGRRAQLNQLAPGEDVHIDNGRVQVSGQVAVMKINGLLCKVIFDQNPTNEFYVEESFPLDWMYPYETPFGVIMKVNRNPLPELSEKDFQLDHKFWMDFSTRLCGNWINYDTSVSNICAFAERTYVRNNYKGYTGDRAFVRDDDAQKAFSKLRSSQAGMYAWRCGPSCPPEYRQKTPASQAALIRETDFAFKQAFAFCPYSPEAVYRYINFLLPLGRFDDALLVAQTCQKLDPYNEQINGLIKNLEDYKKQNDERAKAVGQIDQMENTARTNPDDVHNLIILGVTYVQLQQTNRAIELFDQVLASPSAKFADVGAVAQYFSQLGNLPKLELALEKLAALAPDQPEPHYDLAALQAYLNHTGPALTNLKTAIELSNQRLKTNPAARDILADARKDQHLNSLRALPEFFKIVPPQ
jgi:tetratricopeptide (TPR) repeat protein